MQALSIGELAHATDTKPVTIRFYERMGLLPPPPRTAGNYRAYSETHLHRLRFIRRCRDLGFTLEQVEDLLRLSSDEQRDCTEVDRMAAAHLTEVEDKIADLTRLADQLRRISRSCRGHRTIADCRIIEALSPEGASPSNSGVSKLAAATKTKNA